MSREAMQMAIEALESVTGHFTRTPSTLRDSEVRGEAHKAITVLRQALVDADDTSQERVDEKVEREHEWVGLTDQEVMVAAYQAGFDIHEDYENEDDPEAMHWWTPDGEAGDDSLLKLRDLIEAKLKEKNNG